MIKFICKRIIIAPVLLVLSSLLIFLMINFTPVDPASQMLVGTYTQEQVDALHEELGLDDPLLVQYLLCKRPRSVHLLQGVCQGDD